MSEIPTDPANAIELEIHQRTVKLQREAMSEQKLREALQEYDTAFSDFNPENKKSRERMRRAVVKAREALAQPTSDEGTPQSVSAAPTEIQKRAKDAEWRLRESMENYGLRHSMICNMNYKFASKTCNCGLSNAYHLCKELAATPTPSDSKPGEDNG